jgi:hypothetical protein
MPTEREYQRLLDLVAALRTEATERLAGDLIGNPALADALERELAELEAAMLSRDADTPPPPDRGLAQLVGIGPESADELGDARIPFEVPVYDEQVTSQRIVATADLYYIYQHERLGAFRVAQKLQQLFRAGAVRLSGGEGAFALYQFDKRQVLRYTRSDRGVAYRRVFGYGGAPLPPDARANSEFHRMFSFFANQVARYWRDKRISDVIRERASDPSFGSVAMVRRAALDLRNNLKWASYGHVNVLRVEVMQLLDEAFRIFQADDVRRLFGADSAWDVIEDVLTRYLKEEPVTSPRQRMAIAGRAILQWLAQPHVLETDRTEFEAKLSSIADDAEEWLTSAQALGVARRMNGAAPRTAPRPAAARHPTRPSPPRPRERVPEYEW